ncbi:DNA methyltransferase [Rodentibacter pneumotropicus]|uniref:Site-specific DNA-methyltransferase n=3 Tax=Rodentibacter pneumotropicus TaxID=758 RepID=A0A4S2P6J5_9PAST|nr:DNA methyltransferase [Rodentibacter pneumotropicus]TGZ98569.1 site-specific DNA-methyltransferase [Rodentibacter pneumotropicus]THA14713.1 site-specific DNA-methyltransferase [Rodentibacter pneumotropicus]
MQEIFQINQPDLDFGIYRILNSRQAQIREFLEKTLPAKIKTAFNGNFEQANSVYNHLYTFFSRYYDQGDFISQRRYKGDTYAIPYAGEEVMLHWANKDQYYTKSGENFSNYAFALENGKKVQFRLVEADTAKDNRKDNEQTRIFALIEPKIKIEMDENGDEIQTDILPCEENGDLLTFRFEYKAVAKSEKQAKYIEQAVERIRNFAIPNEFHSIFDLMPTEKNKNRTLLEKYLTDYTAKNSADYFIHKNLSKFLNQELDFYIKNEVMNLDNIQDSTDFSHIEQNLQTIKTLKTVAKEIIAFLAQLEDFQKKLWLKKKFVAGCHYLITLDYLNEAQVQTALNNPKQTAQWQALFNVNTSGLNAAEICKNYPHLVVDTSLFEPKFQADILNNLNDLDEKTNGLLIHSDNFQALNLLQERYKEQVKCIYIDPPYNSPKTEILYKNSFKHSSFLSLIENRLSLSKNLNTVDGSHIIAIDKYEENGVSRIVSDIFYDKDNTLVTVEHNRKGVQGDHFSYTNEYAIFSVPYTLKNLNGLPKGKSEYEWSNFRNWGGESLRTDAANCFYSVITNGENIVGFGDVWTDETKHPIGSNVALDNGLIEIYPIDNNGIERKWRYERGTVEKIIDRLRVKKNKNTGTFGVEIAKVEDQFKTVWCSPKYNAGDNGTTILSNMKLGFGFPKSIFTVMDCIFATSDKTDTILDYFAGSGTTAHAVINLNREDNGNRKYILVEQGEYFDSVLKPRVQKVVFAKEWKDGKPQSDNGAFGGVSQIVKVLKLESYEDTLNNLELKQPASDLFAQNEALQNDYLLHYMLDVESRDSLLNTQHFAKPFDYQLNIATTSAGAYEAKNIDLVETFNYLIGLRVSEINDKRENGLVTVQGTNTSGEKTLIIWRDCEKYDYDKLNHYLDSRDINPQDSEFDVVYINGDHNVVSAWEDSDGSLKTLKVRSIEAEFLSRMFGA